MQLKRENLTQIVSTEMCLHQQISLMRRISDTICIHFWFIIIKLMSFND